MSLNERVMLRVIIGAVLMWYAMASAGELATLSRAEAAIVRSNLRTFERGTLDPYDVASTAQECSNVAAFYLTYSNEVTLKMKLPVGLCFAKLSNYQEAVCLATEYVGMYSNDDRGWRLLGTSQCLLSNYNEAVRGFRVATRLGDEDCYRALGAAALFAGQTNVLREIVPDLLEQKDDNSFDAEDRLAIRKVLAGYALLAKDENTFIRTMQGAKVSEIAADPEASNIVAAASQEFRSKEALSFFREFRTASHVSESEASPTTAK